MDHTVDALIIGAGPGGLGVASAMARQSHTAIVFDSGVYRNARAKHMHNVLGWDHRNPADLRAKARSDIEARYSATIVFRDTTITKVKKLENGHFEAEDKDGKKYTGRKLALAMGIKDIMPSIPGYEDAWGRGIFHCLFCEGLEASGKQSAGLLLEGLNTAHPAHMSRMVLQLAETVRIYTNGNDEISAKAKEVVAEEVGNAQRINIETRKIARIQRVAPDTESAELIITLEDGTKFTEGFMTHSPHFEINGPFAEQLGLEKSGLVLAATPPMYTTNIPGVHVVGDAGTMQQAVTSAATHGMFAGVGISFACQADKAAGR